MDGSTTLNMLFHFGSDWKSMLRQQRDVSGEIVKAQHNEMLGIMLVSSELRFGLIGLVDLVVSS